MHETLKQRGNWRGGGAFDDQLAALHDPDHGVEDLAVGEGYDLVDEALDDGEVDLGTGCCGARPSIFGF